jgi:lysophospholipase L1-like esterase
MLGAMSRGWAVLAATLLAAACSKDTLTPSGRALGDDVGPLFRVHNDTGVARDAIPVADAEAPPDTGTATTAGPDAGEIADVEAAADAPAVAPDAEAQDALAPDAGFPPAPIDAIDSLDVYLNLGDSMGAGYNAGSGRGYAPLLFQNHSAYPAWAQATLQARHPTAGLTNRARSGATSSDVVGQSALLPDPRGGEAIVTVYAGGNDFNDDIRTMLSASLTQTAINRWQQNMTTVLTRVRARYDQPIVVLATIHDPTGGTGTIPANFNDGFCRTIRDPRFTDGFRMRVLANLTAFNDAIRAFAQAQGALLLDAHALFLAHGMNAQGADRWLDDDCAHATNEGHHQLRRELWRLLTNETR